MSGWWKGLRGKEALGAEAPRSGKAHREGGAEGRFAGRERDHMPAAGTNCARSVLSRTRTGVGRCFVSGALPCCCVEPRRQTRSLLTDDVASSVCASRTQRCYTQYAQRWIYSSLANNSFLFSLDTARVVQILVHSDRWAFDICMTSWFMIFCGMRMCAVFTERVCWGAHCVMKNVRLALHSTILH